MHREVLQIEARDKVSKLNCLNARVLIDRSDGCELRLVGHSLLVFFRVCKSCNC